MIMLAPCPAPGGVTQAVSLGAIGNIGADSRRFEDHPSITATGNLLRGKSPMRSESCAKRLAFSKKRQVEFSEEPAAAS